MSSLKYTMEVGSTYDFKLLASAILGSGYSGAKVCAILDYTSAAMLQDVGAQHAQVLSELATGTSSDATSLLYVKLKTSTGDYVVIAQDWLASAPTSAEAVTATVVVNNITLAKIPLLRTVLTENGFTSIDITTA